MYTRVTTTVNGETFTEIGDGPLGTLKDLLEKVNIAVHGADEEHEVLRRLSIVTVHETPGGLVAKRFIPTEDTGYLVFEPKAATADLVRERDTLRAAASYALRYVTGQNVAPDDVRQMLRSALYPEPATS